MKNLLFYLLLIVLPIKNFAQKQTENNKRIPVLAWMGVPAEETNHQRFQELKEAGININFVHYPDIAAVEKALDLAHKNGIKIMAACPELKTEPEKTVKRLMKHPALAGYYLRDEPSRKDFPELGEWARRIQSVDKEHVCYLNLFPTYASKAQLGTETYQEYVETFLKEIPAQFISYDHYPLMKNRVSSKDYYENMEIVAGIAKKAGLPMWAFGLSVAFHDYAIPTLAEIRFQIHSILAYGAQTVQYFTYWTPVTTTWDFHHAPITSDGKRTVIYDRIKQINFEIQQYANVFVDSKVIDVWHTGEKIPQGTKRIEKLPAPIKVLDTVGDGAVVSLLENENKMYLVIVNRDFKNPMRLTFFADEKVFRVLKDGSAVSTREYSNTTEVDPGDMMVYTWQK